MLNDADRSHGCSTIKRRFLNVARTTDKNSALDRHHNSTLPLAADVTFTAQFAGVKGIGFNAIYST